MEPPQFDTNAIAVFSAIGGSLVAFGYKFFRILKRDKSDDSIDSDEQALRLSLREECKMLRENNFTLINEKLLLLERAVKAESERDYLKQKCDICGHKLREEENE
ncbi:MAG: hypothetical protein V9H25_06675 [Candidatus Competibacter sp.]